MKFFPCVLLLLFVLGHLQGSTLPEKRPDGGLNTSLLANFSGLYEKRNPCTNEKMESRSYIASHEFHHHTKNGNWNDYTERCSSIIGNFLKSISNLITFNNKSDGTLTFHVNTRISQNQANQCNSKDQKLSLPTIIIEATNCENPGQNKEMEKGLIKKKSKQEVVNGKEKLCENPDKTFEELSPISQEGLASSDTIREKGLGLDSEAQTPKESITIFETTQSTEPDFFPNTNEEKSKSVQERVRFPNVYFTEQPSMTPLNARHSFMSQAEVVAGRTETSNLGLGTRVETNPTGTFEAVTDLSSEVSQSSISSSSAGVEEMNVMSPADSFTQQPFIAIIPQPPQNENPDFFIPTVTPVNIEKSEAGEEVIEQDSGEQGNLNEAGAFQPNSFNNKMNPIAEPLQPSESPDYLKNQNEFNQSESGNSLTILPTGIPTILPPEQSQMLLPDTSLAHTSSVQSRTQVDTQNEEEFIETTPQPFEDYSANQRPSYLRSDSELTTSQEQDGQYFTTFFPNKVGPGYEAQNREPFVSTDESLSTAASGLMRGNSKMNRNFNNKYRGRPNQNLPRIPKIPSSYQLTTPRMTSAESLIKANQGDQFGITTQRPFGNQNKGKPMGQIQSSESSSQAYAAVSETTVNENQNFPGRSVQVNTETASATEGILNEENFQSSYYPPITPQPMSSRTNFNQETVENFESEEVASQFAGLSEQSQLPDKPPVTQPPTRGIPQTHVSQKKAALSRYEQIKAKNRKRTKPNTYTPQISNYEAYQADRFASESTESFSTKPSPVLSEDQNSPESPDYDGIPNDPLENFNTTPYPNRDSEIMSTDYESDTGSYSQKNQQSQTNIYQPFTTTQPPLLEPRSYTKFSQQNPLISENYNNQPNTPANFETDKENFDSFTANYPTVSETEVGDVSLNEYSPNQLLVTPLPSTASSQNLFLNDALKTTEEITTLDESEYQTTPSMTLLQSPSRPQTNISNKNRSPIIPRGQRTDQFAEVTSDSEAFSQRASSIQFPSAASQISANMAPNDRRKTKINSSFQSANAFASAESFSEKREFDDNISSQNIRPQIPQPQPSVDYPEYSGQLTSNERDLNTAFKGLKTSKTFSGSEQNFQIPVTYSSQSSLTTDNYESDKLDVEYPVTLEVLPESVDSTKDTETIGLSEFNSDSMNNKEFASFPSLTTTLPPPETETIFQDLPTTPLPNTVSYDEEIITIDSQEPPSATVTLVPVQLLNEKENQELVDINSGVIQRQEEPAIRATTPLPFFENSKAKWKNDGVVQKSNANVAVAESSTKTFSSTAVTENKYDASRQQQIPQNVMPPPISNQPATVTYPQNFPLIPTTVSPIHTAATFDEKIITSEKSKSLAVSAVQAPPFDYSQGPTNDRFEGQRRHFPQQSGQFYPEHRPTFYPPHGFPPQRHFENRGYGSNPQFHPQNLRPRPEQLDNAPRYQYNRFPQNFQSEFSAQNQFHPGVKNDHFSFPPNYDHRYSPNERPNFPYGPGMSSEPLSSFRDSPDYLSYQPQNVFNERDAQYQSYEAERLANGNFNPQFMPPPNAQNYAPRPFYPRNGQFERNYEPQFNHMMPPFRNQPPEYFNAHERQLLNNSSQQVENRYQHVDLQVNPTAEGERGEMNQGSPEVSTNFEEASTKVAVKEKVANFEEIETGKQDAATYNSQELTDEQIQQRNSFSSQQNGYQGASFFNTPENTFDPRRPPSMPNRFQGLPTDFRHQPNANFVNPQNPNGGSEGSTSSQSDSYALGPERVAPSRESDPTSRRRFNNPRS